MPAVRCLGLKWLQASGSVIVVTMIAIIVSIVIIAKSTGNTQDFYRVSDLGQEYWFKQAQKLPAVLHLADVPSAMSDEMECKSVYEACAIHIMLVIAARFKKVRLA